MTIANLIQILVLMLLIIIHREIAIVQFKFFVFYIKIYDDNDRHIILFQREALSL
jgi:hypothetical protein